MTLIGCDFSSQLAKGLLVEHGYGRGGRRKTSACLGRCREVLPVFTASVRGMEASGNCQWFLELLGKLGTRRACADSSCPTGNPSGGGACARWGGWYDLGVPPMRGAQRRAPENYHGRELRACVFSLPTKAEERPASRPLSGQAEGRRYEGQS
jgi:hypothetical protein